MSQPLPQFPPVFVNQAVDVNVNDIQGGEFLSWSGATNRWTNVNGTPGKSPNLADVLTVDNSAGTNGINMNSQSIGGVNQITASVGAITTLAGTTSTYTTGNFTDVNATGSATVGTLNYTTLNPPIVIPSTEGLPDTLATNNSAGTNDINMNNQNITNCTTLECVNIGGDPSGAITAFGTIAGVDIECQTFTATTTATVGTLNYTTLNPPIPGAEGLADTLLVSNSAGATDINLNNNDILNGGTLNSFAVETTVINAGAGGINFLSGSSLSLDGTATPLTGQLNLNASTGGHFKVDFTGVSGSAGIDTEIEGDDTLDSGGNLKRTVCRYLDLTDPTNKIPIDVQDYRWGLLYAPNEAITRDFDDTELSFGTDVYFDWSSTISDHSRCIFEIQFYADEYGYGDYQLEWWYRRTDGTGPALQAYPSTRQLIQPSENATVLRDVRKTGTYRVAAVLNSLPTDGFSYRFYPYIISNVSGGDASSGRMIVRIANYNNTISNINTRGAPLIIEARPAPPTSRFRIVQGAALKKIV
jgi:hypothetical protein